MKWDVIEIIVSVCSVVAAFLTRDLYMGKMWGIKMNDGNAAGGGLYGCVETDGNPF